MHESPDDILIKAREALTAAAAKAPSQEPSAFLPYLRAAIVYWRLQEESAQASKDVAAQVQAVTERITCEDQFRRLNGRSFHTEHDAITLEDILGFANPS